MNKTIFFSALGGTDPISETNLYDGSMLHICRVYKPDKVILYMSNEILQLHRKDNRYVYCLEKLREMQNRYFEWEIIEKDNLIKVEDFDYFYDEFEKIIVEICSKMDESDTLILNISSGTPAMKSGLLVLQTIREFNCKLVQVVTPNKKMNEHMHRTYDVETYWEINEENNNRNYENRCREVSCPSLSLIKSEEIIKKHILAYDYQAALSVAEDLPITQTKKYIDIIRMASRRICMDIVGAKDFLNKSNVSFRFPVESGNGIKLFEYALSVGVKLKRCEYADFLRAITPLAFKLYENIIKNRLNIRITDYYDSINGPKCWNRNKISGSELSSVLDNRLNNSNIVKSEHLLSIIKFYTNPNDDIYKISTDIREVEFKIRNLAAHEIIYITDDIVLEKTGLRSEAIFDRIRRLFKYTDIKVEDEFWDSYDNMNTIIIDNIGKWNKKEIDVVG